MDELLAELPRSIRVLLDDAQFAELDSEEARALQALSESTNAYVIAHRARPPHGLPLWDVAGPAYYLRLDQLDALKHTEHVLGPDVMLVAYARPVELRLPVHVLVRAAKAYETRRTVSDRDQT